MSVHGIDEICPDLRLDDISTLVPQVELATSAAMRVALMHELSQPLSALATYIHAGRQLLKTEHVDRQLLAETMKKAETEVLRARDVLARLRQFLVTDRSERVPVDLRDLIKTVVRRLRGEARRRAVRMEVETCAVPIVLIDPPQIRQVLINLVSNAIDAATGIDDGAVRIHCVHESGNVHIEIDDNGRGIAPEIADHLFEPFQTTKSRGMGLGLPLSLQIIEAHGGRIWWERAVSNGTHFHVLLPVGASARYAA
jgi:two-component system sensor kinase FixL